MTTARTFGSFGLALLATLALLTACGRPAPQPRQKSASPASQPVEAESSEPTTIEAESIVPNRLVRQRWTGDLDGMEQRRYIRALVVHSKTFYFYDRGQARGVTYEGFREFEKFLNQRLKRGNLKVNIVFVPVSRDELLTGLVEGKGDIAAANLTITPKRLESVDFSDPILKNVREIVVASRSAPPTESVEDLAGREVHVRRSSSYFESLERLNARLRSAGKPQIRIRPADENLEDEDLLEMVNAGLINFTVLDSHKAQFWAKVFDNIVLLPNVAISAGGAIGWSIRKNSPKLKALINEFVSGHKTGTAFGNALLQKYLRNTKWVRDATEDSEMRKFNATVDLFRKYAGKYEFDWLMVMAQAYQESQLDNNARSSVGAVGIMQVMPSTAASDPIRIQDVAKLENNVHAGVKILRNYIDTYFSDPELTELNRTLLAFASYNAGPNRIKRLRQEAAKEGLDPNVWFRNVELVASKRIGRETVQYVSNVLKYYVAYRLVMQRDGRFSPKHGG